MNKGYIEKSVVFHDEVFPFPVDIIHNNVDKFGILKLTASDTIQYLDNLKHIIKHENDNTEKILLLFTIDHSGSMSDYCKDKKTKMEQIIHTIKNIVRYFASIQEKKSVYIHINIFDDKVKTIIENVFIDKDSEKKILDELDKIYPEKSTNIENALKSINNSIKYYTENKLYKYNEIVHIFLTDGEITEGETSDKKLEGLINEKINNIFIGFGEDHDARLLSRLGNTKNGEYYFVDFLEKAGLIYGEITHNVLHKIFDSVNIVLENCVIYDWKTNKWVSELNIGSMIKEKELIYQIKSYQPNNINISLNIFDEETQTIRSIIDKSSVLKENTNITKEDLTAYIFRQRTQELLYIANNLYEKVYDEEPQSPDISEVHDLIYTEQSKLPSPKTSLREKKKIIKKEMEELLNDIKKYMEEHNETSYGALLKLLCDDIYVTIKTFHVRKYSVYSKSRQSSQGRQNIYTVTNINHIDNNFNSDDEDEYTTINNSPKYVNNIHIPRPRRVPQTTIRTVDLFDIMNDDIKFLENINESIIDIDYMDIEDSVDIESNTIIDKYEFSQMENSPFLTPTTLDLMYNINNKK